MRGQGGQNMIPSTGLGAKPTGQATPRSHLGLCLGMTERIDNLLNLTDFQTVMLSEAKHLALE